MKIKRMYIQVFDSSFDDVGIGMVLTSPVFPNSTRIVKFCDILISEQLFLLYKLCLNLIISTVALSDIHLMGWQFEISILALNVGATLRFL